DTLGARVPSLVDLVFNHKRFVLPLQVGTGGADLIITQGCAVALFLTLLVGRAVADDGFAANDGRLGGVGAGLLNGGLNGVGIMAIHIGDHLPTIGFEALRRIVGKPALDFAIDGDAIIVVEGDQLA